MRKRFQKGNVFKRNGCWVVQWWENGHRRKRTLGRTNQMTKAQAQVELAAIIDPINAKESDANPECALKDFVSVFFFPFYRRKWKRSTAMTTEDRIMRHIVGHFGKRAVGSFTRDELQDFLEEKAKGEFSMSILSHLRWDLKQIFDMAVAEGHISKNPAALLFTPRSQKQSTKNIMNLKEVNQCFDALELRERLIVKFATLAGMRPGEILGLKWGAVKTDHCDISMRIYRGDIDRPKTSHSVRKAALSESLLSDLDEWRSICPEIGPDAWVFPSEQGDTAIWRDNIWRRRIHPMLKAAGLGWVNFQVMRRTHSSLMNELEVDPKIVADQLGHTLDVNQNVYTKAALHRRSFSVNVLDEALRKSLMEPNGASPEGEAG